MAVKKITGIIFVKFVLTKTVIILLAAVQKELLFTMALLKYLKKQSKTKVLSRAKQGG